MIKLKSILATTLIISTIIGCTKAVIDEPTDPITGVIKFDPDVQNIMFNHCVTCHGGVAPSAGVDLTTYDAVRHQTESGTLIDRINDASNPMPPNNLMSEENRQIIAKWVTDGYLEN